MEHLMRMLHKIIAALCRDLLCGNEQVEIPNALSSQWNFYIKFPSSNTHVGIDRLLPSRESIMNLLQRTHIERVHYVFKNIS
jgi:hypothetical protein